MKLAEDGSISVISSLVLGIGVAVGAGVVDGVEDGAGVFEAPGKGFMDGKGNLLKRSEEEGNSKAETTVKLRSAVHKTKAKAENLIIKAKAGEAEVN